MQIINDGYNLIGSDAGSTGNLEHKRNWLVQKLESFHRAKGHDIRVVLTVGGRKYVMRWNASA